MPEDRPRRSPDVGSEAARTKTYTRRGLLALGGVAGAGLIGTAIVADGARRSSAPISPANSPTAPPKPVIRRYESTDLTTSTMNGMQTGETGPGVLLVQPQENGFNGVIMDNRGEPFWIAPTDLNLTDLRVQEYQGRPVLTYWSGKSVSGHGVGTCTILDTGYRQVATVQAPPGMEADLHEFHLTPQGTALLTSYPTVKADLRSVGGPKDGYVLDCHICEIDIATRAVLFSWSSLSHIPLEETFASVKNSADADGKTVPNAFDAYHMNSIDFDDDGHLYVSSRHTHTIYCLDRATGDIVWRMGGKSSDFTIAEDARFAWQHHVRKRANGAFSIFDNHSRSSKSKDTSRGLLVNVDETEKTVTLQKEFRAGLLSIAMGSMDLLENGNWILGWGTQPVVTEHRPDGKAILRIDGLGTGSYRGFRQEWTGTPVTVPAAVAKTSGDRMAVYMSWNGATEVRNWRISTGPAAQSLGVVDLVARSGFETKATVRTDAFVMVEALDIEGAVLAASDVITPR